ncbi:MAG: ThuA domain-containing protein [Oscillospiraceae bacterium]
MIRVTVYNEFLHEKTDDNVKAIYPEGIHNALKEHLTDDEITVKTVTLDNVGDITDGARQYRCSYLVGHMAHDKVPDEVAKRVQNAVLSGMGAVFLHSAHHSKPFKLLMGTPCSLGWREDGDRGMFGSATLSPDSRGY